MSANRRQFMRVQSEEPGLLEFLPALPTLPTSARTGSSPGKLMVPVMISSVACEGLSLYTAHPIDTLSPRARIVVRLTVYGQELDLPGRVAWVSTPSNGSTNIGVSLLLPLATAVTRHTWANWIVKTTEQHRAALRARGSGAHSIQHVSRVSIRRAKTNKPHD